MNENNHKILVIADGGLNYTDNDAFSIKAMLDQVSGFVLNEGADTHSFELERWELSKFRAKSVNSSIHDYIINGGFEQLWLFGRSKYPALGERVSLLDADELNGIDKLMKANALGVFATGDHDEIGAPLCGSVPRVRFLRRWHKHSDPRRSTPRTDGAWKAETLSPALIPGGDDTGEYDATPKTIWSPNAILSNGQPSAGDPHPLCFHPQFGRISFLPDHLHEGMCRLPPDGLDAEFQRLLDIEFPVGSDCQIAAWCMRATQLVAPQVHPIISSFDHPELSRIVTDSTFHHWIWGNIEQLQKSPSVAWDHIRQYPRNIAAWLAGIEQIADPAQLFVAGLRMRTGVFSALLEYQKVPSEDNLGALGRVVVDTISSMNIDAERARALLYANQEQNDAFGLSAALQVEKHGHWLKKSNVAESYLAYGGAFAKIVKSSEVLALQHPW